MGGPGSGPKKMPDELKRSKKLAVCMTLAEFKQVHEAAKDKNQTLSNYVRQMLLGD